MKINTISEIVAFPFSKRTTGIQREIETFSGKPFQLETPP
jgi:hypothetical protein